jgi:hypothetical protein
MSVTSVPSFPHQDRGERPRLKKIFTLSLAIVYTCDHDSKTSHYFPVIPPYALLRRLRHVLPITEPRFYIRRIAPHSTCAVEDIPCFYMLPLWHVKVDLDAQPKFWRLVDPLLVARACVVKGVQGAMWL